MSPGAGSWSLVSGSDTGHLPELVSIRVQLYSDKQPPASRESCHDPGDKVRSLSDSLAIIRELHDVDSEVTPGGSSIPLLDVCNIWDNLIFLS